MAGNLRPDPGPGVRPDRTCGEHEVSDRELVPDARGRTRRPEPGCPVEIALAAVAGRWTTLVLRELMSGPCSFGELDARLPEISPKILTERLRRLEQDALVVRERLRGFPVRTRYVLTPAGRELRPLLVELYRTGAAVDAARGGDGGTGRAGHPSSDLG